MNKLVKKIVNGEHISPVLPDEIKNYLIDIDGTICDDIPNEEPERMETAKLYPDALETINGWYDEGHIICFFTARFESHREITEKYAQISMENGADIKLGTSFEDYWDPRTIGKNLILETSKGVIETKLTINCAGLYSDVVAKKMGVKIFQQQSILFYIYQRKQHTRLKLENTSSLQKVLMFIHVPYT